MNYCISLGSINRLKFYTVNSVILLRSILILLVVPRNLPVLGVPKKARVVVEPGVRDPDHLARSIQSGISHRGVFVFVPPLDVGRDNLVGSLRRGLRVDVHHLGLYLRTYKCMYSYRKYTAKSAR